MSRAERGNIKAVIFDLDGLLLDTEDIYTKIIQDKLKEHGKDFTWDIKAQMMGKSESEARRVLLTSLWPDPSAPDGLDPACPFDLVESKAEREDPKVIQALLGTKPMPGALRLVQHLAKHKIPMAIASGSSGNTLMLKRMKNADLFDPFGSSIVTGDDARLRRNKPHPDIFLLAAHSILGARTSTPEDCQTNATPLASGLRRWGEEFDVDGLKGAEGEVLVFEDAISGVQAGAAAGMKVVWVPHANLKAISPSGEQLGATQVLDSLEEFAPEEWGLPSYQQS
ncbi:hypothetical protein OC844_002480 [Tilletia horrida]|nr:hypothetical protein OC844_002480 [Tilletia horrida]